MFLNAEEINTSMQWLLENASPPVQYLTRKHILNADPESAVMQQLWNFVLHSSASEEIFSCQNEDGSWFSGGPWGPRGYRRESGRGFTMSRPKFVTTAWILPFLGEMGFNTADERVRKACELILHEEGYDHPRTAVLPQATNCCGISGIPLRALASVGMAADERLRPAWEWLTHCQREDGGWLNPRHLADSPNPSTTIGRWPWDRSCAWGSYFAVEALYSAGDAVAFETLRAALEFLLWHLGQADPQDIQTWAYHGHNIVRELLMFSESGFDMQAEPIRGMLDWLKGYYRPKEGVFRTQGKPIPDFVRQVSAIMKDYENSFGTGYWKSVSKTSAPVLRYHLYHLVEEDWLTYTCTRIALNESRN